jgi:hypothetical protein
MVNRLYLTKGWTTTTWSGNGNTLVNNVPSGLTKQNDGSVSSLNPGDVITLDDGGFGHAAIINSVGSTIQIVNQNTPAVYSSASLQSGTSFSAGNADIDMSGWAGYNVQAIVHHPATTTASNRPGAVSRDSSDMDTFYQSSSGNNLVDRYWNSTNGWNSTYWSDNIAGVPSAVARTSGNLDVFFSNTGNNLVDRYWTSSGGWNSVALVTNGTMRGNPTVIHPDSNNMDVFYRDSSNNLVDEYWNSTNGWNSTYWTDNVGGDPAALTRSSSSMDVFYRNTGNNLVDRYWTSSLGWNTATIVSNGTISADPGVVAPDSNHMDAFYKDGTTSNLYDRWWDSTSGWNTSSWSVQITGVPSAISRTSGNIDVFARTSGNNLIDQYWTSSGGWNTATLDSSGSLSTDPSAIDRDSSDMDVYHGKSGNLVDEYWNSTNGWNSTYWGW